MCVNRHGKILSWRQEMREWNELVRCALPFPPFQCGGEKAFRLPGSANTVHFHVRILETPTGAERPRYGIAAAVTISFSRYIFLYPLVETFQKSWQQKQSDRSHVTHLLGRVERGRTWDRVGALENSRWNTATWNVTRRQKVKPFRVYFHPAG